METSNTDTQGSSDIEKLQKMTSLSKILALVLFIALPLIGAYVGYTLHPVDEAVIEKQEVEETEDLREIEKVRTKYKTVYVSNTLKCTNDSITQPMRELQVNQRYGRFEYKGSHCLGINPNLGDQQVRSVTFYFESPTPVVLKGKKLGLDSGRLGIYILESEFEKLPAAILGAGVDPVVSDVRARRSDNRLNLGTGNLLMVTIYEDQLDDIPVAYEKQTDVTIQLSDLRLNIDIGSMHGAYYLSSDSLEIIEYQEIDQQLDFSSVM